MGARRDPIALVEACYDLRASEEAWLQRLADAFAQLVPATRQPVLAYHLELTPDRIRLMHPVQSHGELDVVSRIRSLMNTLEQRHAGSASPLGNLQAKIYERVVRAGLRVPADQMLLSEVKKLGPDWMYTLGVPGVRDVFHSASHHIDGQGATLFFAGLSDRGRLRPAEREMYQMLSAHIKAGMRLRRRLERARERVQVPSGGAVLDAASRFVHAEGEARECSAREALQGVAKRIDQARTVKHGRDERALEVWQGLVQGRWSLVEQFDADGKRFILAHRNPEHVVDPRGLSPMESRVTGLAVRGYSNKLIAYHLGVPEGTASAHLSQAMRKLGFSGRVELVRVLGTHYPQNTDRRFTN